MGELNLKFPPLLIAKLKVWWKPQVPMKSFEFDVSSIEEGRKFLRVLADYDLFQLANRIKPDYSNAGGIVCSHPAIENGDWIDAPTDEDEFAEWMKEIEDADSRELSRLSGEA